MTRNQQSGQPSVDDHGKDVLAEVGALCNAAKYMAAEAAFKACERAGKRECSIVVICLIAL